MQQSDDETGRRPSPTSRARRAAAAGVVNSRRPSPTAARPVGESTADTATGAAAGGAEATRSPEATQTRPSRQPVADKKAGKATPRPTRAPIRPVVGYGLVVAAVLLIAVNVLLAVIPAPRTSSQADRDQVLSDAKTATQLVISYDYHHVQADAAKAATHLTGAFATDYRKSIDSVIAVQAPKVQAVVEGQIDTAAIESVSGSGDQVTVIVFGEQKVTNTSLSQPRTDIVRLRVTMDRVGNDWKIAKLDQI